MADKQPHVLLVEEDPTLRDVTSFRLELLGFTVSACESAEAALTALADWLPDVCVVGHFLPGMDGLELVDRLSNDVRTSRVPVMFLSPNSDLEDVQKAFTAGADEFLVTPYDPLVLEAKIGRLAQSAQQPN